MTIYTDGYTISKNPSPIGGGYTVVDENKKLLKHERFVKEGFTNNEGELRGILYALEIARAGDKIITDSSCAKIWAENGKAKARPDLDELCTRARELLREKSVALEWRPRGINLAGQLNERMHIPS